MTHRRRYLYVLLFVIGLIAAAVWVISDKPTRLGLDLRGGVELIYQGRPTPQQPEVTDDAIERSIQIIRERVNELGVSEPEVSRLGTEEITVSLPDVEDADRAIDQVGQTSQLYFYDWEPNIITDPRASEGEPGGSYQSPFNDLYRAVTIASRQEQECDGCTIGPRWYMFSHGEEKELIAGPGTELREDILTDANGDPRPASAGEILKVPQGTLVLEGSPESDPACLTESCYWVVHDRPELSGTDLEDPQQNFDPQTNQPNVTFEFTDEGRESFHEVTRRIAQRGQDRAVGGVDVQRAAQLSGHFAVVLDREVVSRPIINFVENPDGIDGRTGAQISGDFTIQEAQDLATFLQIGALPINLELISQTQVSATLGQIALEQGLRAGALGLALVLLFLLLFYRFLGFVAGTALIAYGILFFALIKLIPITLTLPGIAGLILTIGVAADSNIVIFERIKEEVRAGRGVASAIAIGYRRGISTIIDANVVTLLAAFILFVLATAGVQGFAFTLGIGTLTSLLTAVVFTQAMLGSMGGARFLRSPRFLGAGDRRFPFRVDFTGISRWMFTVSGCILVVGAFSYSILGINFGIDFQSGTRVTVAVDQPADEDDIGEVISEVGLEDSGIQRVTDEELGDYVFQFETTAIDPDEVVPEDEIQEVGEAGSEAVTEEISELERILEERYGIVQGAFNVNTVGPTFGAQVAQSAVIAVILSLLLISAYVAVRFEPKFAIPVLIAIIHDLLITGGIYSVLGREMTTATVAALLTIQGYSLYDTIIVFDRVRENLPRMPRATFSQVVNRSMNEILVRSLVTSLSTLTAVLAIFVFGGETLEDFALAILIGVVSGTYSSLFIAAPILSEWKERDPTFRRRREAIEERLGYVPSFEEDVELEVFEIDEGSEPTEEGQAPAPSRGTPRITETETERQLRQSEAVAVEEAEEEAGETRDDTGAGEEASRPGSEPESGSKPRQGKSKSSRRRRRKHGRPR